MTVSWRFLFEAMREIILLPWKTVYDMDLVKGTFSGVSCPCCEWRWIGQFSL